MTWAILPVFIVGKREKEVFKVERAPAESQRLPVY
jgi:hypothetical protein